MWGPRCFDRVGSRGVASPVWGLLAVAGLLVGCEAGGPGGAEAQLERAPALGGAEARPNVQTVLRPEEIDLFLAVVRDLPAGKAPEFTSDGDPGAAPSHLGPTGQTQELRRRFRAMFDPKRQGKIWGADAEWQRLCARHGTTTEQFAQIVVNISAAVTTLRVQQSVPVGEFQSRADRKLRELVKQMETIDALPVKSQTKDVLAKRNRASMRLGPAAALVEFAELLRQVPRDNEKLVRGRLQDIDKLLPSGDLTLLLASLEREGIEFQNPQPAPAPTLPSPPVRQAGREPAESPRRR